MDSEKKRPASPEETGRPEKRKPEEETDEMEVAIAMSLQLEEPPRPRVHRYYLIESGPTTEEEKINERLEATEKGSSTLKTISEELNKGYNDGRRVFVNRLRFYKEAQENMLSFKQLCFKDLGFRTKLRGPCEVQTAILTTMVFEAEVLDPLITARVPITVFLDRDGPLLQEIPQLNMNLIFPSKQGPLNFGVFHPKLMLLEFDDRLRVVVSSSNLYIHDWELMSQVIWFQDFTKGTTPSEFGEYLSGFMKAINPKNAKVRRQIALESYDFSTAAVKLVASVNGRHVGGESLRFGQNRIGALVGAKKSEGTFTYQTSSLGKLN